MKVAQAEKLDKCKQNMNEDKLGLYYSVRVDDCEKISETEWPNLT